MRVRILFLPHRKCAACQTLRTVSPLIMAVYSENYMENVIGVCGQNEEVLMLR
jgi:hypothetical protein